MASYQLRQTMDRSALTSRFPRLDEQRRQELAKRFADALGTERVIFDRDQLLAYSYDATGERHWPDVVVMPDSAQHVASVVKIAHAFQVPIIGRGASTNLSGGTTPLVGGVVVSFTRMRAILDIDIQSRTVRVQPGVVNAELQAALAHHGFFYPPDPSSHRISTIGGNVAENSGGPHCVKYGVTTHHVVSLEACLSDGSLVALPPVGLASDLDLASVVIGSEGTLALVTQALLSIQPLPESTQTLLISFRDVADATKTVSALVAAGLTPACLELMDRDSIRIVEDFVHAGYPTGAGAVLLIELDGSPSGVEADARLVRAVAERIGCLSVQAATDARMAAELWRGRRSHYGAAARLAPHLWVQDVTVPRPQLAAMMDRVLAIGEQQGLTIVTAAHAGDGNLHPSIPFDPEDPSQVARLKAADHAILAACVEFGGAITGEHGIGIDKAEHLPLMYNADELAVMGEVKRAFDPEGLLNPLKALWPPEDGLNPPRLERSAISLTPRTTDEVRALILDTAPDSPLRFVGQSRRSVAKPDGTQLVDMRGLDQIYDLDRDNLSVEVGAGISAGTLARLLHAEGLDLPTIEPFMDETVGGLVASNAKAWRWSVGGGWRNWLLAAEWVDGRGRVLRFGRKTMKNVAGYDLAKLTVGSRGTIGALTRLTLKLRPRPTNMTVAVSEPMTLPAAQLAQERLLAHPQRPGGLLLVHLGTSDAWRLWAVFEGRAASEKSWISTVLETGVEFEEGYDAWLSREKDRLHTLYRAIQDRRYRQGPLIDVNIGALAHEAVFVCPGAGWYEMMGDDGNAVVPQTAAIAALTARVRAVFDPLGRFVGEG
ncbi:FAD-binding oxidoreductase [Sulfobacillus harzensis]|uniref:FAD-binding protein n=1 Tax=Sulfobacillus harzensis TaxID=2729629 RepID=A0A7Y0L929_9FIRM|nr:FAD-binding oxidoreductase [Sulfobacillus harzensis]NMP24174.1 FAD-binding protein [Sulfobacillus harzensis]